MKSVEVWNLSCDAECESTQSCGNVLEAGWVWIHCVVSLVAQHILVNI